MHMMLSLLKSHADPIRITSHQPLQSKMDIEFHRNWLKINHLAVQGSVKHAQDTAPFSHLINKYCIHDMKDM